MSAPIPSPPIASAAPPAPRRFWLQIALVYAALEGALWTLHITRAFWSGAAMGLILAFTLAERNLWPNLGIAPRRIRQGWWIAPAGLGLALLIVALGDQLGTLHQLFGPKIVYWHVLGYAVWSLVQEFIAQGFFFLRLEALLRSAPKAVAANAALFALAHLPSPVLFAVTLAGGAILSELFRRYRTIYVLAVAHIVVALSIAVTVPAPILRNMRVGIGYLRFHPAPVDKR